MKNLVFILLLLPSGSFAQNVSGNVKDFHFNQSLNGVIVTLNDQSPGNVLGIDTTDASGNFSIDYTLVGVGNATSIPRDYSLSNAYPNPFNPSTKINFYSPVQDRFTVRIYNILGQLVYENEFTLNVGNSSFRLSGFGSAGVYLFNISGKDFSSTQKMILLDGGEGKVNVEIVGASASSLDKTAYTDFLIEFRKPGYYVKDTIVSWNLNLLVNTDFYQIPVVETKTINGVQTNQQTGEAVKSAGYEVRKTDGTLLKSGQLDVNGLINEQVNVERFYWVPLDSTVRSPDSLVTILNKELYNQKTYSKKITSSNTVDITGTMVHQGRTHAFTLRNYDVSGFDIDSMTVMLITPDGNIPVIQQTNNLNVNYTEFHDDAVTEVQMKNLNPKFLDWVSVTTTDNYIQYLMQNTTQNTNLTIPLALAEGQGTMEAYWVPARVEHPYATGQFISMNSDTVKSMLHYNGGGDFFTSCFRSIAGHDSVTRVLFTNNITTGNPVDPTNLNTAISTYDSVTDIVKSFEGNGKKAVKTTPIYQITGPNSQFFQDLQTAGFQNVNYIYFKQTPTPGNHVDIAYPEWRMRAGYSFWAEGTGSNTMFSETYSSITHIEDPFTSQALSAYVLTNGQPSDLGKKMANLVYVFEPGSIFE